MTEQEEKDKKEAQKVVQNISDEKADKVLSDDGLDWLCTVHLKLRVPCDKTCGFLDNWEKDHERCPKRVHKTDIVFGQIFGGKKGWVKKET